MFDILFAYIFSIYGNEYGCKMIKKIDILGIQLDNYTVREAIMRVEAWYDNNMLNVIEMVSMQMLTESESDPVLKEVISSLDLAVIGEKGILQAAGVDTMQRIRETEENDFSDEFLKRVERNRKSVFIIGETQGAVDEFTQELREEYPKLVLAGAAATENCVGDLEGVINEMNAATPDVIIQSFHLRDRNIFLWNTATRSMPIYGMESADLRFTGKDRESKVFLESDPPCQIKNSIENMKAEVRYAEVFL